MSDIIAKRLEELGMNTLQLSRLSGIANSYINQLMNGLVYRPGRDKLIRIGIGLYFDIQEMNALLSRFDYNEVSLNDISYFMEASDKIEFYSGLTPRYYASLTSQLLLLKMEKIQGNMKFASGYPPFFLWGQNIKSSVLKTDNKEGGTVYVKLNDFIISQRKNNFDKHLSNQFEYNHLICRECFKEFLRRDYKVTSDKKQLIKNYEILIYYILNTNYNMKIVDRCTRSNIQIIEPHNKKEKPIVLFGGKVLDHFNAPLLSSTINGFISNSDDLYNLYISEFRMLEKHVIDECADKKGTVRYILQMLREEGIDMEYDLESV